MRLAAVILLLTACLYGATPPWSAANYRGLVMGRAHREDVTKVLGAPDAANHGRSGDELVYRGRGEHKGDVTVRVNAAGVVTEIQEAFPISIPRTQIYKELGKDAMTAHYSTAKCADGALYRDGRGAIELTLYPERGIALWTDQYGYDFAAILYVAKMPGLARAPACVGKH